jgi:hypothetical protein
MRRGDGTDCLGHVEPAVARRPPSDAPTTTSRRPHRNACTDPHPRSNSPICLVLCRTRWAFFLHARVCEVAASGGRPLLHRNLPQHGRDGGYGSSATTSPALQDAGLHRVVGWPHPFGATTPHNQRLTFVHVIDGPRLAADGLIHGSLAESSPRFPTTASRLDSLAQRLPRATTGAGLGASLFRFTR